MKTSVKIEIRQNTLFITNKLRFRYLVTQKNKYTIFPIPKE